MMIMPMCVTPRYMIQSGWCEGHMAWAPEGQSQASPKGPQLEVGAPRLLVLIINLSIQEILNTPDHKKQYEIHNLNIYKLQKQTK